MPRCVQGAVLVFGQRNPGFRKTDLLRLEGFKVAFFLWSETGSMGTGIEPVMIPRLAVHPDGEIVQNIPVFGNATERQLGGCVIAVLHGKVDRQIVRRDLGEQITAPETGKYDAAHRRQDGAFHRPGGVFGAVMIRKQVAGKCLALPAVKQREAPGCRVNGPQTGAQILRLQLADVGDGLGLPGFQLDVLHISGAVPLVQAGKGSFSAVTAVSEQGDKVFLIEIGRRGIGVLYIQVDLHLPEIVAVILGKGTDVIHPQAAYRGHGSAALRRVACAAKQAGHRRAEHQAAGNFQEAAAGNFTGHKHPPLRNKADITSFYHTRCATGMQHDPCNAAKIGQSAVIFSSCACTLPCST